MSPVGDGILLRGMDILVASNSPLPRGARLVDADGHMWLLDSSKSTVQYAYYTYKGRAPGRSVAAIRKGME